jgi:hypothetical protein
MVQQALLVPKDLLVKMVKLAQPVLKAPRVKMGL